MVMRSFPQRLLSLLSCSALASGAAIAAQAEAQALRRVVPVNRHVVGAVAEIISATPDGRLLAYSNSGDQAIGLLDISDPQNPVDIGEIDVSDLGEPTSVAMTPDGRYAIAAVLDTTEAIADQQPGHLVVIDVAIQERVGQVRLNGIGPDSIAITPDGSQVVVAIEDEEDEENLPGDRPGAVDIVTLNYDSLTASTVQTVDLSLSGEGINYPSDPQPEFMAISPDGTLAAVTLQENNAVALIDIAAAEVTQIFSAGTSVHERADLIEDDDVRLTQPFEGRREPDAIAFTPDGQYLVTANEGDTDLERFGDGICSGGRGWTIFDLEGNVVYDSGSSAEEQAVWHGQYPEGRSENRGVEMEGVTTAEFDGTPIALVASERGSFLLVYDISDPSDPVFLDFLPTGLGPEGIIALPERNLILTANEDDGTIDIFEGSDAIGTSRSDREPLLRSSLLRVPFGALSGIVADAENPNVLYAVPDNAFAPSRIFRINLLRSTATVVSALPLTKGGEPVSYDLEGIALHPNGGYWLVSEGDNREGRERPNLLIRVSAAGTVQAEYPLPEAEAAAITRFGFEGVTTSADGSKVYIAIQREFEGAPDNQVRIAEFDVATGEWAYYLYQLDTDNVEESWVGLSDIALDTDGSLLILERDNQGGEKGASNVRVKRIYRVSLEGASPGDTLEKTLVSDLRADYNWLVEKAEGLAVVGDGYWVVNDNDGGETYNRLLFVPR